MFMYLIYYIFYTSSLLFINVLAIYSQETLIYFSIIYNVHKKLCIKDYVPITSLKLRIPLVEFGKKHWHITLMCQIYATNTKF